MSYLKVSDFLINASESKYPDAVSSALSSIRGDIVSSDRDLIMGLAYAVFHVFQMGDNDSLERLLKGLRVLENYASAIAISDRAINEDNGGVLYQVKCVFDPIGSVLENAQVICRSLICAHNPAAQLRILRVVDSMLKQQESLTERLNSEVLL